MIVGTAANCPPGCGCTGSFEGPCNLAIVLKFCTAGPSNLVLETYTCEPIATSCVPTTPLVIDATIPEGCDCIYVAVGDGSDAFETLVATLRALHGTACVRVVYTDPPWTYSIYPNRCYEDCSLVPFDTFYTPRFDSQYQLTHPSATVPAFTFDFYGLPEDGDPTPWYSGVSMDCASPSAQCRRICFPTPRNCCPCRLCGDRDPPSSIRFTLVDVAGFDEFVPYDGTSGGVNGATWVNPSSLVNCLGKPLWCYPWPGGDERKARWSRESDPGDPAGCELLLMAGTGSPGTHHAAGYVCNATVSPDTPGFVNFLKPRLFGSVGELAWSKTSDVLISCNPLYHESEFSITFPDPYVIDTDPPIECSGLSGRTFTLRVVITEEP